jgi:hypothetical protein
VVVLGAAALREGVIAAVGLVAVEAGAGAAAGATAGVAAVVLVGIGSPLTSAVILETASVTFETARTEASTVLPSWPMLELTLSMLSPEAALAAGAAVALSVGAGVAAGLAAVAVTGWEPGVSSFGFDVVSVAAAGFFSSSLAFVASVGAALPSAGFAASVAVFAISTFTAGLTFVAVSLGLVASVAGLPAAGVLVAAAPMGFLTLTSVPFSLRTVTILN